MNAPLVFKTVVIAGVTMFGSFVGAVWGLTLAAIPGWFGAAPLPDILHWVVCALCALLLGSFASVAADAAINAEFYEHD